MALEPSQLLRPALTCALYSPTGGEPALQDPALCPDGIGTVFKDRQITGRGRAVPRGRPGLDIDGDVPRAARVEFGQSEVGEMWAPPAMEVARPRPAYESWNPLQI